MNYPILQWSISIRALEIPQFNHTNHYIIYREFKLTIVRELLVRAQLNRHNTSQHFEAYNVECP